MAAVKLYLVRHGQTEWNRLGLAQGHTDTELDEQGREQAMALATRLERVNLDWVISSDLRRSVETARLIAPAKQCNAMQSSTAQGHRKAITTELDPALRERAFGEWEGRPYTEVRDLLAPLGVTGAPPGGESYAELFERISRFCEGLLDRHGSGLVISHGGTTAILLSCLIGGTAETARGFRFSNCGLTTLERRPDGSFVMIGYNDCAHLDGVVLSGDLQGVHRS